VGVVVVVLGNLEQVGLVVKDLLVETEQLQ
jgi:hypothetical protein